MLRYPQLLLPFALLAFLYPNNIRAMQAKRVSYYRCGIITRSDSIAPANKGVQQDSLFKLGLNNKDEFFKIKRKDYDLLDHQNFSDLFNYFPFGFLQDLGYFGQPSFIYLFGNNAPSFLLDGNELNNRFTQTFNPYQVRNELADSILIVYPTRGFLFNNSNNGATVILFPFNNRAKRPYSKIWYFQGENDQGLIDGTFNIKPFKKTNVYIGINNSSISPNYANTDFSLWKTTLGIKYSFSNKIILNLSYNYSSSNTQLFGGVSSLNNSSQTLFSPLEAKVNFPERYSKNRNDFWNLNFQWMPLGKLTLAMDAYYNFSYNEFRQNEKNSVNIARIFNNNIVKTAGLKLRAKTNFAGLKILTIENIERNNFSLDVYKYFKSSVLFSFAFSVTKSLFDNNFTVSLFGKYLNKSPAAGADVSFNISRHFSVYAGYSYSNIPAIIEEEALPKLTNGNKKNRGIFFTQIKFTRKNFQLNFSYLQRNLYNNVYLATNAKLQFANPKDNYYVLYENERFSALNSLGYVKFNKFKFDLNFTYNFNQPILVQPKIFTKMGFYYFDTLFNRNLKMKVGLIYSYSSNQAYRKIDFQINKEIFYNIVNSNPQLFTQTLKLSNKGQLDFFFAGNIRNRATLYFTIKNILNEQYYIVPYYPMEGRTFLFGVKWKFFN